MEGFAVRKVPFPEVSILDVAEQHCLLFGDLLAVKSIEAFAAAAYGIARHLGRSLNIASEGSGSFP